jgi:fumarylacetoacetate (FAA) hydrolase family protein
MQWLPEDGFAGTLVGRAWVPGEGGQAAGPSVVALREDGVFDLSETVPTMSGLLETADPAGVVRKTRGRYIGTADSLMHNSQQRGGDGPYFLAPCDLQVIKAAGVTFADSLVERVIEEQAKGDASQAEAIRGRVLELLGGSLARIEPGSAKAQELKALLVRQGLWSQYLEVGIGPDAEVFTKGPVLSAVGTGAQIGLHPGSDWNNPEPEVVLAVNSRGETVGATLGNDVNLRDFEGRSALLLSKAKDNNASCAIGPLIRLFDESFTVDDMRRAHLTLTVKGEDGFRLEGESTMTAIARDPLDLVEQTINPSHQYPDGFALFLGTLFAPVQDRSAPGKGFTHKSGDVVAIESERLGTLVNRVTTSDAAPPWTFGARALMRNLAARGLL